MAATYPIRPLRYVAQTLTDLPFLVLEQAHWVPGRAFLREKDKPALRQRHPDASREVDRLRAAWPKSETWLNLALAALFMALPQKLLAAVISQHVGGLAFEKGRVVGLDSTGLGHLVGEPDLVLLNDADVVLIESKVATKANSHRYSFPQLTKYMLLGTVVACAENPDVRRTPYHLLLVPDEDPRLFCDDAPAWSPQIVDGRLRVDPTRITGKPDDPGRFASFAAWQDQVRRSLKRKVVSDQCPVDPLRLERMLSAISPVLLPTFVVTYRDFLDDLADRCRTSDIPQQAEAAMALRNYIYAGRSAR